MKNKIIIICGHYGCGKTNLAINIAIEESKKNQNTVVADMDIVNPYFRTGDYKELFDQNGIKLISPTFLGTTTDTPSISASLNSVFVEDGKTAIIDLGGDDVGATAIASFRHKFSDYEMIYVINKNRLQSSNPKEAKILLDEIETASKLKATAVVNNTHLGVETTKEILESSVDYANEFCKLVNLPLLYSTAPDFVECDGFKKIKRYVKFPWEYNF